MKKRSQIKYLHILIVYLCTHLYGCKKEGPSKQELWDAELQRREMNFFRNRTNNCLEELSKQARQEAIERVIAEFGSMQDSIAQLPDFPHKPNVIKRESKKDGNPDPLFEKN